MDLQIKIRAFAEKNGRQLKWIADQLGIPKQQFYQVLIGRLPLPIKYWDKIISITNGEVSLKDIIGEKWKKYENIEIKETGAPNICLVSLKGFKNSF